MSTTDPRYKMFRREKLHIMGIIILTNLKWAQLKLSLTLVTGGLWIVIGLWHCQNVLICMDYQTFHDTFASIHTKFNGRLRPELLMSVIEGPNCNFQYRLTLIRISLPHNRNVVLSQKKGRNHFAVVERSIHARGGLTGITQWIQI